MIEIILIEIISIVSFLYSIFMLIMPFTSAEKTVVLFIWTSLCAIVYALLYKKHKIFNLSIILLLLPLIYFQEMKATIFILSTSLIIFIYIRNSLLKGSYYVHIDQIKKSYLLYIPLIYIKTIMNNFAMTIGESIPFIVIYIFSSIIFLRTIRHLDSNMGMKTIRKNNAKNILILSLIFPIVFFQNLRDIIKMLFEGVLNILFYPMEILGTIIGSILEYLFGLSKEVPPQQIIEDSLEEELVTSPLEEIGELVTRESRDFTIIKNIILLMLLILIIYIVYRTIKKSGTSTIEDIDYVEEREYIKDKQNKKSIFQRDKYPKDQVGQIRYYYRKFLNKLDKKGIEILKTDSSLEINEKANDLYQEDISRIREIYINSRYSNYQVKEEDVKEMEDLYKKL